MTGWLLALSILAQDAPAQRIAQLCRELSDADLEVRERALEEVIRIGEPAIDALVKVAQGTDAEGKARATTALRKIGRTLCRKHLKLEVSADKRTYRPDETITVRLRVVNGGKTPAILFLQRSFLLCTPGQGFRAEIPLMIRYELVGRDPAGATFPRLYVQTANIGPEGGRIPVTYTAEVAEEDFTIVEGGGSFTLVEETALPQETAQMKGSRVYAPHKPGKYTLEGSYGFDRAGKPKNVQLVFKGAASGLWEDAFAGTLKAARLEFTVAEGAGK